MRKITTLLIVLGLIYAEQINGQCIPCDATTTSFPVNFSSTPDTSYALTSTRNGHCCGATVNAADSTLSGGGGVDRAIHKAGGITIIEECKKIIAQEGRVHTGDAVITNAGILKAKKIIHAVGPVWKGGNNGEENKLASTYRSSIELAAKNILRIVAFPNISTGVYGYPKDQAAQIAIDEVVNELQKTFVIHKIIFVCYDKENYQLYLDYLAKKYGLVSGRFTSILG